MPALQGTVFVALVFACAASIHGYSGFGFGIVAMSLLSILAQDMPEMYVVVSINALVVVVVLLFLSRVHSHVDWLKAGLLLLGVAIGQPVGYWFLRTFGDHPVFHVLLGLVLLYYAVNWIVSPTIRRGLHSAVAVGIGAASGLIGGAFVSGGPPVVMYLYSQADDPRDMKPTVQSVFLVMLLYRLVLIGMAGDYSAHVLRLSLYTVPLVIPLILIGHALSRRGPAQRFRRYVYGLIALFGVSVFAKGLWAWLYQGM